MSAIAPEKARVHRVLTPEGVALPFVVAAAGDRVSAFLLDLLVIVSGTVGNPAGWACPDSYIVHDAALVRDALAIGMTALASDRQIRVYVTDSCDAATGRPLVISIGLM